MVSVGKKIMHPYLLPILIQKAIGWALKEYSKTNRNWINSFVKKTFLSPLSKREALKRIIQD